jgi:hypothetical protein
MFIESPTAPDFRRRRMLSCLVWAGDGLSQCRHCNPSCRGCLAGQDHSMLSFKPKLVIAIFELAGILPEFARTSRNFIVTLRAGRVRGGQKRSAHGRA